jgi:hypothetical protein
MYLKRKRGRTSSKGKTCKALSAVRSSSPSPRLADGTIVRPAPLSNIGPSRPFPSFPKGGAQRPPLQPVVTHCASHPVGTGNQAEAAARADSLYLQSNKTRLRPNVERPRLSWHLGSGSNDEPSEETVKFIFEFIG